MKMMDGACSLHEQRKTKVVSEALLVAMMVVVAPLVEDSQPRP
jgi:hypothetical protein